MTSHPKFLGTGWAFPPSFANGGAAVQMVSGAEDIAQSLHILLGTQLGERIMREDFGSDLHIYQFEEISQQLVNQIQTVVARAIVRYETRIDLLNVKVDESLDSQGTLLIQIHYQIRGTNSRFNMVYPFYLNEANV